MTRGFGIVNKAEGIWQLDFRMFQLCVALFKVNNATSRVDESILLPHLSIRNGNSALLKKNECLWHSILRMATGMT